MSGRPMSNDDVDGVVKGGCFAVVLVLAFVGWMGDVISDRFGDGVKGGAPEQQEEFINALAETGRDAMEAGEIENDLVSDEEYGNAVAARKELMCDIFSEGLSVEGWRGEIKEFDGSDFRVEAGERFGVDVSLEDSVGSSHPLADVLKTVNEGDTIEFDGKFSDELAGRTTGDCVDSSNLTVTLGMSSPDFPFSFTSMKKVD